MGLADLDRAAEPFLGEVCLTHVVGEYFFPEDDAPAVLKTASESVLRGVNRFRINAAAMEVSGGPVQQLAWMHRPNDSTFNVSLSGWFRGKLKPDILTESEHGRISVLRDLMWAEGKRD